jgi:hypothetical protein
LFVWHFRKDSENFELTRYILAKGGDTTFEINWNYEGVIGQGKNWGTAYDYATYINNYKVYNSQMISLLDPTVMSKY